MPYLIDGHNLIGQMPDIDLFDPDDEAKLVLKLRSFAGRVGKRITVVFDGGLPAGLERSLSTHSVKVRFASAQSSADRILRNIIRQIKNPAGWILVCSDVAVIELALRRKMNVISAQQFAHQLSPAPKTKKQRRAAAEHTRKTNPHLSQKEIDEWLVIFGANPDES